MEEIAELRKLLEEKNIEIRELKQRVHELEENLRVFIPRSAVRDAYNILHKALNADVNPRKLEKKLKRGDTI